MAKFESRQVCDMCWTTRNPNRTPVRVRNPFRAHCYHCGMHTTSGIFVRVEVGEQPAAVDVLPVPLVISVTDLVADPNRYLQAVYNDNRSFLICNNDIPFAVLQPVEDEEGE